MDSGRGKQKDARARRGTKAKKKAEGRGAAKLSKAAGQALDAHSALLADSLMKSTLTGHVHSARLLLELAEGQAESAGAGIRSRLQSLAGRLAAEPEWTGEVVESTAETGPGPREPEG